MSLPASEEPPFPWPSDHTAGKDKGIDPVTLSQPGNALSQEFLLRELCPEVLGGVYQNHLGYFIFLKALGHCKFEFHLNAGSNRRGILGKAFSENSGY